MSSILAVHLYKNVNIEHIKADLVHNTVQAIEIQLLELLDLKQLGLCAFTLLFRLSETLISK